MTENKKKPDTSGEGMISKEREVEIRTLLQSLEGLSLTRAEQTAVDLLAALDARRTAHRKTQAEVERLREVDKDWLVKHALVCAERGTAIRERDEAREDAVRLADSVHPGAVLVMHPKLAARIATYRKDPDPADSQDPLERPRY